MGGAQGGEEKAPGRGCSAGRGEGEWAELRERADAATRRLAAPRLEVRLAVAAQLRRPAAADGGGPLSEGAPL